MPKFNFRLATLLRLREATRDECRVELAEVAAGRRGTAAPTDADSSNGAEAAASECRQAAGPGAVDLPRLVEADATCRGRCGPKRTNCASSAAALAAEIDRRRQALLEADRDVRTLEKLRENQLQAHRQDESRQEAKQLDEAALQGVER